MKKTIKILVLLSTTAVSSYAQSSAIFYGGNGDGGATESYIQSIDNILLGGNADGWGNNKYAQTIANMLTGGSGDGWNRSNYQQAIANTFLGGSGDGWMRDSYNQPTNNILTGGGSDGWSNDRNVISYAGPYKGGEGDGWASTYTPLAPLPVTFLRFDAVKERHTGLLNWELAKDDEVASFEVERSSNAVSFTKIGAVLQSPEANRKYNFRDKQPVIGANYYRIKIYEKNGKQSYTPTRVLDFGNAVAMDIKVYPVPATVSFNIEFPEEMVGKNAVMNIYAVNGALVRQMKLMPLKASKIETGIADLADGNYLIHIAGANGQMHYAKMVKVTP